MLTLSGTVEGGAHFGLEATDGGRFELRAVNDDSAADPEPASDEPAPAPAQPEEPPAADATDTAELPDTGAGALQLLLAGGLAVLFGVLLLRRPHRHEH